MADISIGGGKCLCGCCSNSYMCVFIIALVIDTCMAVMVERV